MADENLIAINVPNAVSIVIMALVGGVLLSIVRKLVLSRMSAGSGDNAGVPGS